jgi:ribosomal protein L7Ae-like RNA K-turn-binding protein
LFDRVFKEKAKYPGAEELLKTMFTAIGRQIETLLRSGAGARLIAAGADSADRAFRKGGVHCILVAKDSARSGHFADLAAKAGVPVNYVENKERLGALIGRKTAGEIAVLDDKLATALVRAFDRLKMLD